MPVYWVLDTTTGNRIGEYRSLRDALDAVRREVVANDDAEDLALEHLGMVVAEGLGLFHVAFEVSKW